MAIKHNLVFDFHLFKSGSGSGASSSKGKSSKKSSKKKNKTVYYEDGKVKVKNPGNAPATWKQTEDAPVYVSTAVAPEAYVPGIYQSEYTDRINAALDKVTNWSYDPLQDASYQALAKVYTSRGNTAAKNSLADAAALNGGFGTSYAVSAAQQARNQYNQELASYIPQLEQGAYSRASTALDALRAADDTAYGRFRDTEGDRQWAWTNEYQKYRDLVSDEQYAFNTQYNTWRDNTADSQFRSTQAYNKWADQVDLYKWGKEFNTEKSHWQKEYDLSKKAKASGGGGSGGGGGHSGGGSGYTYTNTSSSGGNNPSYTHETIRQDQARGQKLTEKYKKQQKLGNGGR